MNSIFSATKYFDSPEGLILMKETNNQASHLEQPPLAPSYGYAPAGNRTACLAGLPRKSKSFMRYAG